MRYADIIEFDICNGEKIGVSLFVQGCHFHCKNCFNQSSWDFSDGNEFNQKGKDKLFALINRSYIKRFSVLGGEPLAKENATDIIALCKEVKEKYPEKIIWLYSGYTYETVSKNEWQKDVLNYIDYLVDGQFVDDLKDFKLKWRGSSNQRVIDVKASLGKNEIVLYCD